MNLYYALNENDYTWGNALLWGNFIGHCKKAGEGQWGDRVVHALIAGFEFLPIMSQIASVFEKLIVDHFTPPCERGKKLLEKALASKVIKNLYERANAIPSPKGGPWTIKFRNKVGAEGSNAECNHYHRRISIRSSSSDERALCSLVFELTNSVSYERFAKINLEWILDQIDCEEFVKRYERIEHEGTLLHHQIITEAIQEMGWSWSEELDKYWNQESDFERYWNNIKDTPHANYYRERWGESRLLRKIFGTLYKICKFFNCDPISKIQNLTPVLDT